MSPPPDMPSLGDHIRAARRRIRRSRPLSFYLLVAMVIFVLGSGLAAPSVRDNPRIFFAFLAANFVFLFVVMAFAIRDSGRIVRGYLRDHKTIHPTTLGEREFTQQLAQRITPEIDE